MSKDNQKKRPLKRAVIKEELVDITGDYISAIILQQLIYWSERRDDADKFLEEEIELAKKNNGKAIKVQLSHGWIYKKAEKLAEEIMIPSARQTVRRRLASLVEAGFINERRNPVYRWDQTVQYRVNLNVIQSALKEKGYHLEGYGSCVNA